MRANNFLRTIATGLKWLLLAIGALLAALFAINSFDETRNPEIAAFLARQREVVKDEDNAYFAVIGLTAPRGADIHKAGESRFRRYESFRKDHPRAERLDLQFLLGPDTLALKGDDRNLVLYLDPESCVNTRCPSDASVREFVAANDVLLRRYLTLYKYPRFYDTAYVFSGYTELIQLNKLLAARALLDAKSGRLALASQSLGENLRFLRRALKDHHGFATNASLQVAFGFTAFTLAEIVHLHPKAVEMRSFPRDAIEPEAAPACSLAAAYADELDGLAGYLSQPPDVERDGSLSGALKGSLIRHFLKMNASHNYFYERIQAQLALFAAPDAEFQSKREVYERRYAGKLSWDLIYNPVGKLVLMRRAGFMELQGHCRALTGLLRLASLQFGIHKEHIADADIQKFISAAGPKYANPMTGKPMLWDEKERRLVMLGGDGDRYLSIRL